MNTRHPAHVTHSSNPTIDLIAPARAEALSALLDRPSAPVIGEPLPELWHWIYFWQPLRQVELGGDGYRHVDGELTGMSPLQHMWAGSRLRFHAPLPIGVAASLHARVSGIEDKQGRRGRLTFVTTHHTLTHNGRLILEEARDVVHIESQHAQSDYVPGQRVAAPEQHTWQRVVRPTEALLFRYSALTFNSHRIHYDYPYTTGVEGYPHLVVHGPLLATLLVDLLHRSWPGVTLREFNFKAVRPTFLGHPFTVCGHPNADGSQVMLWAKDHQGALTMSATAVLA